MKHTTAALQGQKHTIGGAGRKAATCSTKTSLALCVGVVTCQEVSAGTEAQVQSLQAVTTDGSASSRRTRDACAAAPAAAFDSCSAALAAAAAPAAVDISCRSFSTRCCCANASCNRADSCHLMGDCQGRGGGEGRDVRRGPLLVLNPLANL
jgi:hypothetical protein